MKKHTVDVLYEKFIAQAKTKPQAIALECGQSKMSYGELDAQTSRYAFDIRNLDIKANDIVIVQMSRCIEMVIGLIAALKAGAAVLLMDPKIPREVRANIIKQTRSPLILLHDDNQPNNIPLGLKQIAINLKADRYDGPIHVDLACPDSLAYCIYTSGSTGRPKGSLISHKNTSAYLGWFTTSFTISECARTICATSISFDLTYFELFGCLSRGGTAILVDGVLNLIDDAPLSPTMISLVPSVARVLLEANALSNNLMVVGLAGEAVPAQLVRDLQTQLPRAKIVNLYGPSECAMLVASYCFPRPFMDDVVPIGKALPDTELYLLDHKSKFVRQGTVAELFIGGTPVGQGYLDDPEATAAAFISNPFESKGAKIYRTGDRAYALTSGEIVFVGRMDDQVKINGVRIELNQVEFSVRNLNDVSDAAAIVNEVGLSKEIVIFIVMKETRQFNEISLRKQLDETLPRYMQPTLWVRIDSMPLNGNGKPDRARLARTIRPTKTFQPPAV